jgi:hypothetical protein
MEELDGRVQGVDGQEQETRHRTIDPVPSSHRHRFCIFLSTSYGARGTSAKEVKTSLDHRVLPMYPNVKVVVHCSGVDAQKHSGLLELVQELENVELECLPKIEATGHRPQNVGVSGPMLGDNFEHVFLIEEDVDIGDASVFHHYICYMQTTGVTHLRLNVATAGSCKRLLFPDGLPMPMECQKIQEFAERFSGCGADLKGSTPNRIGLKQAVLIFLDFFLTVMPECYRAGSDSVTAFTSGVKKTRQSVPSTKRPGYWSMIFCGFWVPMMMSSSPASFWLRVIGTETNTPLKS